MGSVKSPVQVAQPKPEKPEGALEGALEGAQVSLESVHPKKDTQERGLCLVKCRDLGHIR